MNKALEVAKEVENIKLNTDIDISTEDMAKLVSEQYKKAHNSTDQSKSYELSKTINISIPPGTDLDNGEIYDKKTGETIKDLI